MTPSKNASSYITICTTAWILAACTNAYPPLEFTPDGNALRLQGVIDARALEAFDQAMDANPDVEQLIFDFVPGSVDDDSNLKLARQIRALELRTRVPENGLTASGGTDLFLAGTERSISSTACLGVHTWGDASVGIGSDISKDHPIHQIYLDYYREMEIPAAFYWFTLDAAGPDDSHWMSISEIETYNMLTEAIEPPINTPQTEHQDRCDTRFDESFEELLERE